MRMVVTGASGMLGHCLMRLARRKHEVWGSYHTHRVTIPGCSMFAMDLTDEAEARARLRSIKPDIVVHAAALTDVDECERSPAKAQSINSEGTKITAKIAEELGAGLVYISTDYVFDGAKGNYVENDAPSPVNGYGKSKLLGEQFARQCCSRVLILRTTMFGLKLPPRSGMLESLIGVLRSGEAVTRFVDQYFTPLYTRQFGEVILQLIDRGATGLLHIGAAEKVSRFEFCQLLADLFAPRVSEIRPVAFRHIEGVARRPRDSSLVSRLIEERTGIGPPTLRAGLAQLKQDWDNWTVEGSVNL